MYKSVLVAIDLADRETAERLVKQGMLLAGPDGGQVHILTVVPSFSMSIVGSYFPEGFEKKALKDAQAELSGFLDSLSGTDKVMGHVAHGTIYDEIMKAASVLDCDLIVLASQRPELKDYLLGPNAARVVRHASQSVLVVRSN